METLTWYTSLSAGTHQGTDWKSYQLTSSLGALPSNAIVSSIKYSLYSYTGAYTTKGSWKFQLYGFAVQNGPYVGASYDTTSKPSSLVDSIDATISSSGDESIHTYDFQNGSAWVYGENVDSDTAVERTHCDLIECLFSNDTSAISAFSNNTINVKVRFNNSGSATQYLTYLSVTVEYETVSLTSPTNLTITQHATNGTYTLKWDAAVGTNGTGNVTYQVWSASDGEPLGDEITTTSYTANVPGYEYFFEYRVYAYYSGVSASSVTIGSYFNPPSITAPTLSLLADSGDSATLVWSNPIINYGTASKYDYTIQYSIDQASNDKYTTITNQDAGTQTLTIPSSWFEQDAEDGEMIVFNIVVTAHINSHVADSAYKTLTITTDTVFFTYDGAYTVGYYTDSGWQSCIVYCYTDTGWKECIPYYYNNNSKWIPIKTKI